METLRYSIRNVMVAWNYGGPVQVGPWPDYAGWSDKYDCTDGACGSWYQDAEPERLPAMLLALYQHMTAAYAVPPADAHAALSQIEEYRIACTPAWYYRDAA